MAHNLRGWAGRKHLSKMSRFDLPGALRAIIHARGPKKRDLRRVTCILPM